MVFGYLSCNRACRPVGSWWQIYFTVLPYTSVLSPLHWALFSLSYGYSTLLSYVACLSVCSCLKGSSSTVMFSMWVTSLIKLSVWRQDTAGLDGNTTLTTWDRFVTHSHRYTHTYLELTLTLTNLLTAQSSSHSSRRWCHCLCCHVKTAGSASCMMGWMLPGWTSRWQDTHIHTHTHTGQKSMWSKK